jgi:hypothetical protein
MLRAAQEVDNLKMEKRISSKMYEFCMMTIDTLGRFPDIHD